MSEAVATEAPAVPATAAVKGMKKNGTSHYLYVRIRETDRTFRQAVARQQESLQASRKPDVVGETLSGEASTRSCESQGEGVEGREGRSETGTG